MSKSKQSCAHPFNHQLHPNNKQYAFCMLCGSLLYFNSNDASTSSLKTSLAFAKPAYLEKHTEIDLIDLFRNLSSLKAITRAPPSEWYIKNRKKAIAFLQKVIMIYKFSDSTFHLALCYIDILLSNAKDLPNSKVELNVISSLLLAAKFIEHLLCEPNLSRVIDLACFYDETDIVKWEIFSLKKLEYKLNRVDPYAVFMFLLNNGFVFAKEIQHQPREYINIIYCFAKKTFVDFLFNSASLSYDYMQICFSVIHFTRKHFGLKPQNFKAIRSLYDYHYSSYKECLNAIKLSIENSSIHPPLPDSSIKDKVIKSVKSEGSRQPSAITHIRLTGSKSFCFSKNHRQVIPHLLLKQEVDSTKANGAKLNKSCKQLVAYHTMNQLIKLRAY